MKNSSEENPTALERNPTTVIFLIDFDGCVFNKTYREKLKEYLSENEEYAKGSWVDFRKMIHNAEGADPKFYDILIEANLELFDFFIKIINKYPNLEKIILASGSNRVNPAIDIDNSFNTGIKDLKFYGETRTESAYTAIIKIMTELQKITRNNKNIEYDPFVITDLVTTSSTGITPHTASEIINTIARGGYLILTIKKISIVIVVYKVMMII